MVIAVLWLLCLGGRSWGSGCNGGWIQRGAVSLVVDLLTAKNNGTRCLRHIPNRARARARA
eukprot:scaffold568_cov160-Amphora_coffeaeformis.AAC.18